jgi:hypothetical protein
MVVRLAIAVEMLAVTVYHFGRRERPRSKFQWPTIPLRHVINLQFYAGENQRACLVGRVSEY